MVAASAERDCPTTNLNETRYIMATIRKRGNSYLFRCYDGYNAAGRQIERTMTWNIPDGMSEKKAEKEAHRLAALFEERVRTGNVAEKKSNLQHLQKSGLPITPSSNFVPVPLLDIKRSWFESIRLSATSI